MAIREDLVVPGEGEENYVVNQNPRVVTIPFSPLEIRMEKEKPEVFARLQVLKEIVGEETFKRLVSRIHNINYAAPRILIVANSELHRTNIERELLPAIAKAFEVDNIRVVTQG